MATQAQRIYGLAMSGHGVTDIAYVLDITEAAVRTQISDLTSPAVVTLDNRIHDLAAAGHDFPAIAYFLGITAAAVKASLKDLTKGPTAATDPYVGNA